MERPLIYRGLFLLNICMKKLILSFISMMTIAIPTYSKSFNEIIHSNSNTLECMITLKCKDGVRQIYDISDIANFYPDSDYSIIANEFNRLLIPLNRIGVKVFLADEKYFPDNFRGIYSTSKNNFYLNQKYMYDAFSLITTMRHEGWHVAQDCKAGIDNRELGLIIPEENIPQFLSQIVEKIYYDEPNQILYEKGAFWASTKRDATQYALDVCTRTLR